MATHSSVLAWRIPGMEEPGGLLSMGSHRVGHYWSDLAAAAANCLLCPIFKVNPHCRPLCMLAQLCPTLCNPTDCSPQVSRVHGIFLARIPKWAAFPPPRDPPDPVASETPASAGGFFTTKPPGNPTVELYRTVNTPDSSRPLKEVWLHLGTQPGILKVLSTFYFMIKKVKLLSTQGYWRASVIRVTEQS